MASVANTAAPAATPLGRLAVGAAAGAGVGIEWKDYSSSSQSKRSSVISSLRAPIIVVVFEAALIFPSSRMLPKRRTLTTAVFGVIYCFFIVVLSFLYSHYFTYTFLPSLM